MESHSTLVNRLRNGTEIMKETNHHDYLLNSLFDLQSNTIRVEISYTLNHFIMDTGKQVLYRDEMSQKPAAC